MLNKEKYLDNILSIFIYNNCHKFYKNCFGEECFERTCSKCKFSTVEKIFTWLNEEYYESEPKYKFLKNGDNLKPGDWIMVSYHGTGFCKRQFLFFHNGLFYTTVNNDDISVSGNYTSWKLARLPEDGE